MAPHQQCDQTNILRHLHLIFRIGTATRVDGAKVAAPSLTFRVITALSHGRVGRWGCGIALSSGLHRSEHRVVSQIPPANKQDTFVPPPTLGMQLIIAKDFRTRTGQVLMIPGIFYQIFKYPSDHFWKVKVFEKMGSLDLRCLPD